MPCTSVYIIYAVIIISEMSRTLETHQDLLGFEELCSELRNRYLYVHVDSNPHSFAMLRIHIWDPVPVRDPKYGFS